MSDMKENPMSQYHEKKQREHLSELRFYHATTPGARRAALNRMAKTTLIEICMRLTDAIEEEELMAGDQAEVRQGFEQEKIRRRQQHMAPLRTANKQKRKNAAAWQAYIKNHVGDANVIGKHTFKRAAELVSMMQKQKPARVRSIPSLETVRKFLGKIV